MSDVQALLARAVLWRWVARALWYPEANFLASLGDPAARAELEAAAAADGDGRLAAALADLWQAVDTMEADAPSLPEEYTSLFQRHVRVPLHETSYGLGLADRAQALSEVGGYYAAFGFQVAEARPETPDHASAECAFVAALLAKEVYALAQGWDEQADLTAEARAKFVAEHPATWLAAFAARLGEHGRLAFYPAVATLALALLAAEPADAPPGLVAPSYLATGPMVGPPEAFDGDDGPPVACGGPAIAEGSAR